MKRKLFEPPTSITSVRGTCDSPQSEVPHVHNISADLSEQRTPGEKQWW